MARFAALLRGMNLGNRRIKNPDLVRVFNDAGFAQVEAFLASGNVAFDAIGKPSALAQKIEKSLGEALSYEVPTFVRKAKELSDIAGSSWRTQTDQSVSPGNRCEPRWFEVRDEGCSSPRSRSAWRPVKALVAVGPWR